MVRHKGFTFYQKPFQSEFVPIGIFPFTREFTPVPDIPDCTDKISEEPFFFGGIPKEKLPGKVPETVAQVQQVPQVILVGNKTLDDLQNAKACLFEGLIVEIYLDHQVVHLFHCPCCLQKAVRIVPAEFPVP